MALLDMSFPDRIILVLTGPTPLCSAGHAGRRSDASNLLAGADDALTSGVGDSNRVLVLGLGALPDLNLAAAAEDANTHGGEQVVGGVGVVVDTTVEDGRGVLADGRRDEGLATRVVGNELANVVDDTGNGNPGLAVLGLLDKVVPADDGQGLQWLAPVESGALLVELLLLLLETALLDLVLGEGLEVVGEADPLHDGDEPLGRVILPPLNSVAEVAGELVVEVVVALAEGHESGDDVVARRVAVIEGLVTEPVGQAVDAEGGLLDEEDAEDTGVDEAAPPVVPAETADESRNDQGHGDDALDVVAVLPDDDGVLVQVGDVGAANAARVLLHDHPADVAVEQALANRVGILVRIGVAVVRAVQAGPPTSTALDGSRATGGEEDLEREPSLVARVSPQTVVASS
jgi:hypothetical protein